MAVPPGIVLIGVIGLVGVEPGMVVAGGIPPLDDGAPLGDVDCGSDPEIEGGEFDCVGDEAAIGPESRPCGDPEVEGGDFDEVGGEVPIGPEPPILLLGACSDGALLA